MRRQDLRNGAEAKIADAILLLENRRYSNAYYLAGYAIELGLKACIARQVVSDTIPDREFFNKIFSHEFPKLISLAGLAAELKRAQDRDRIFAANWAICDEWRPDVRYRSVDGTNAELLVFAVANDKTGVFPWIRNFW